MLEKEKTGAGLHRESEDCRSQVEALRRECADWKSRAEAAEEDRRRLEETGQTYRYFFENAAEGFFRSSPDGRLLHVNPAFSRMLGYESPEEALRSITNLESRFYADSADRTLFQHLTARDGRVERLEFRARRKDGAEIWLSLNARGIRSADGRIVFYEGIVKDITQSRQTETALRESERRLAEVIEFLPDATLAIDREGRIIAWNRAIEEMTGFKAGEMIGKGDYEYALPFYGKRRPILIDFVFRWDEDTAREYSFIHLDGEVLVTETRVPFVRGRNRVLWGKAGPLYDADGRVVGAIESIRDVTERKQMEEELQRSEEKYRNILETMEEAYFEVDLGGRFTFFNDAACTLLGYSRDEMEGKHFREYTTPASKKKLYEVFGEVYRARRQKSVEDYEVVCKDGSTRIMQTSAMLISDKQGLPVGFRGLARDVTARRHMEERLLDAQKMEAVGTLAGGIAHDFNNLLMGIQGYASLIMMDMDTSSPQYERLKRIEDQVRSGAELTRQLLGFARGGRYEIKPTDINEILLRTSSMFGRTRKQITMTYDLQEDVWTLEVDRGQMEQAFLNLYLNACQAMPEGGEIHIETRNVVLSDPSALPFDLAPGPYVQIAITDTGVGMDENTRKRIFDPFFTTKNMGRGVGLGLSMVYGIVRNHRGAIHVETEPGQGATFTVCLPASDKAVVTEQAVKTEELSRGGETLLVVDDEATTLEVTRELLTFLDYRVYTAGSGQEGLAIYAEKQDEIDLVIIDMIMPGISGSELFDRLRAMNPAVKVLLSSGYSINGQAADILARGCNGFIQKPFRLGQFSQKIREILGDGR